MKWIAALSVVIIGVALAVVGGSRLSSDVAAMGLGVLLGTLASIPAIVLVAVVARAAAPREYPREPPIPPPPVVLYLNQAPPPQPVAPPWEPRNWHEPVAGQGQVIEATYTMIGK